MRKVLKRRKIQILILLAVAFGLIFIWRISRRTIEIGNSSGNETAEEFGVSPLSGLNCENYQRRPIAIVLASDPVTRPLAGLSEADLVLEMPVITNSITRVIAVYLCSLPETIGSLRSARHDFIPLTMGLDAIFVHWGGSHFALDDLDNGIMDNIDALENPFNAFYQKRGIPQPHNGFTSKERLINAAEKLGYRLENNFEGYPHLQGTAQEEKEKSLKIGYTYPYNVEYKYQPETNSYLRWRAGIKEIDSNNGEQIKAKNIVVMRAYSRQIEGPDYNDLDIEGEGKCQIFQNGIVLDCTWKKSNNSQSGKLFFLDENEEEIPFTPGQTWIEIVEPGQKVSWE